MLPPGTKQMLLPAGARPPSTGARTGGYPEARNVGGGPGFYNNQHNVRCTIVEWDEQFDAYVVEVILFGPHSMLLYAQPEDLDDLPIPKLNNRKAVLAWLND